MHDQFVSRLILPAREGIDYFLRKSFGQTSGTVTSITLSEPFNQKLVNNFIKHNGAVWELPAQLPEAAVEVLHQDYLEGVLPGIANYLKKTRAGYQEANFRVLPDSNRANGLNSDRFMHQDDNIPQVIPALSLLQGKKKAY